MTTEDRRTPLSLYRLLPSMREFQMLQFDDVRVELMRWQLGGSTGMYPTELTAEWVGDPRWKKNEFPTGTPGSPVLSRRIADLLRDDLEKAGRLLPVRIEKAADEYLLYLVERVADCLDMERSSPPDQLGRVQRSVFRPEAVPVDVPAFRTTGFPTAVCWNGWAVERLTALLGDQLEVRLVWSEDPGLVPHHNPWGF
ncbi:hypothetical protein BKI49_20970 [Streptomyces sp. Tue6028]|uniref:hypothetical protein n=1 Tax=Streptomyces sp. Tue6028 TaxID=2036037 RepID=UPI000BB39CA5|nr:hypothetical protein [Streptomyces sp. Tue6028]PBC62060.1 hypothetical protein BKI49_20970 [Streptomyces sp. Tue6028]